MSFDFLVQQTHIIKEDKKEPIEKISKKRSLIWTNQENQNILSKEKFKNSKNQK